ncbi:12350_t:CDS:2, partial [Cetraspora pellucida]
LEIANNELEIQDSFEKSVYTISTDSDNNSNSSIEIILKDNDDFNFLIKVPSKKRFKSKKSMHEIYKKVVINSLERYCDNMKAQLNKRNKKFINKYQIGDLVYIKILEIDRTHSDRMTLLCKVLKILENNMYRIRCKLGVLEITYNATEILSLGPKQFSELENIPSKVIGV